MSRNRPYAIYSAPDGSGAQEFLDDDGSFPFITDTRHADDIFAAKCEGFFFGMATGVATFATALGLWALFLN